MVKKKKVARHPLLHGCYYTEFAVHPVNWEEPGADPNCEWYFTYRFFDPLFKEEKPYGKQVQIKGTNGLSGLLSKRQMMKELLADERVELEQNGYNHFTKQYMAVKAPEVIEYEIHPETPFIQALECAYSKIKVVDKVTLKSVLKFTTEAISQLRYHNLPVNTVKKAHMKKVLQQLGSNKGDKWTDNNYNHYRAHLSMLFKELIEWDALEYNPLANIPKRKVISKKRQVMTMEQRRDVYEYLRLENFPFWLHMNIFFMAGCRRSEIMRVRGNSVDLVNQKFKTLSLKGKAYREVEYTITDAAVPLWQMALQNCKPTDYVFSKGLIPGSQPINPKQITRRWYKWVKTKIGIEADWYSLKHMHTTEVVNLLGTAGAADFNNESEKMITKHYDILADDRKHNAKRKIINHFLPAAIPEGAE